MNTRFVLYLFLVVLVWAIQVCIQAEFSTDWKMGQSVYRTICIKMKTCVKYIDVSRTNTLTGKSGWWSIDSREEGVRIQGRVLPCLRYTGTADLRPMFCLFFFFLISYFTWVFIQVLPSVLPWSPGSNVPNSLTVGMGFHCSYVLSVKQWEVAILIWIKMQDLANFCG